MLKKICSFLAIFFIIICILIGGAYIYVKNNIYEEKIVSNTQQEKNNDIDEIDYEEVEGINNVLLIGSDEREGEESSRSDSMIIATLDNNNKNIKLTSLYRDTLVDIPGYGEGKINSAYQLGGVNLLLDTIKENYDIKINDYIVIDFNGFEKIIDEIGGVEINVEENVLSELNKYIGESTGGNSCPVEKSGNQLLNGKQALAYSRIRYNCGDDYERAERQRKVLIKIAEKIKDTSPIKYLSIMNVMLEYIRTDIDPIDALNMAYTIYSFDKLNIKQISIPVLQLTKDMEYKDYGSVLITDINQNAEILNDFIYEDKAPNEEKFSYNIITSLISKYEEEQQKYVGNYDYSGEIDYINYGIVNNSYNEYDDSRYEINDENGDSYYFE